MKYQTIVIDPAWTLENCGIVRMEKFGNRRDIPYDLMTDEEIENFPIIDSLLIFVYKTYNGVSGRK